MKQNVTDNICVPYKGIQKGVHQSDFKIGTDFFGAFENADIQDAALDVCIVVEKTLEEQVVSVNIKGYVVVPCDRCLAPLNIAIDYHSHLEPEDVEEALDEGFLHLDQYIYDMACLSIPIQRVHNEGECDSEMMKIWEGHKAKDEEI